MLTHYDEVVKHKRLAKYLVCKKIRKATGIVKDLQEALKIHDRVAADFPSAYTGLIVDPAKIGEKSLEGLSFLEVKRLTAERMLEKCILCERRCKVNRFKDMTGFCGVDKTARVSSYFLHMGEERQLIPSGTVFFSGCTFRCAYNMRL
ncbi:MAG: hypothetical protein QW327_04500 [Candidatus Odinarchaeota archaeon]